MVRRLLYAVVGLAVLVLLAGCNLAAKVVVQPDGSGSYSVIMSVPNAPSNPGQALYSAVQRGATGSDFPLTVTRYSSGGGSGAMLTFHFQSLADLNAESHRLAAAGKGGIGVTVYRDANGWHFSASTALSLITAPALNGTAHGNGNPGGLINGSQLG